MFRKGFETASGFTFPVLISRRSVKGDCSATIGTFFVVNDEGWFVTVAHLMEPLAAIRAEEQKVAAHRAAEANIRGDQNLSHQDRAKALKGLGKLDESLTEYASVWWGGVADDVTNQQVVGGMDLAVGKFVNFDPTKVRGYPVFRTPVKGFAPGSSLWKLGFPFFFVCPTWDAGSNSFLYPTGSLPPVIFPLEGMLTRTQHVQLVDKQGQPVASAIPLSRIETSTPGLKGQSGGPIVDVDGTVWAMQSQTAHMPLGFEPKMKVNGKEVVEHQVMNMGLGPSSETIVAVLNDLGVKHKLCS